MKAAAVGDQMHTVGLEDWRFFLWRASFCDTIGLAGASLAAKVVVGGGVSICLGSPQC